MRHSPTPPFEVYFPPTTIPFLPKHVILYIRSVGDQSMVAGNVKMCGNVSRQRRLLQYAAKYNICWKSLPIFSPRKFRAVQHRNTCIAVHLLLRGPYNRMTIQFCFVALLSWSVQHTSVTCNIPPRLACEESG